MENRYSEEQTITGSQAPGGQTDAGAGSGICRVGIYSRASTNRKTQLYSMSAQVSELTRLVCGRTDWKLTDIYLDFDSASTGGMQSEFKRMLSDAKAGKLDLIITKSIQRFGRNPVESMRTLVASGTAVCFRIEGITSDIPELELQAALYSALAQAESGQDRQEGAWGVTHEARDGTWEMYKRACYGYTKGRDGALSIDRDRAEVVREIYTAYLGGSSISGIGSMLEERHIPSPTGGEKWPARTIDMMLSNAKYYGTIILFKTMMLGYADSIRGNAPAGAYRKERYYVTDGVDSIIDEETFRMVQAEKNRRSNYEEGPDGKQRKKTRYSSKRSRPENMSSDTP